MIRLTAIFLYVTFLSAYAFKDWYKSLCGLILLMGVIQHPDVPRSMFGVTGLNPWNVLLFFVVVGWLSSRSREGLTWDMPPGLLVPLCLYLLVLVVSTLRLAGALAQYRFEYASMGLAPPSMASVVSEFWINTFKWLVPGFLLYDGCRDRRRWLLALLSVLGIYVVLGIQVIKWMPPSSVLDGAGLTARSLKIIQNEIGYSRVNMSMLLCGGSWAVFATLPLARARWHALAILATSLALTYAQALTGGRMGYVTWAVIGLVLCLLRWRRYLLVAPLVVSAVLAFVPGARERMLQGFTPQEEEVAFEEPQVDDYSVTSGRTMIWPFVVQKIRQAPWTGYGREAMVTTGLWRFLATELGESFPHPHNAYLQMLLDSGWLGLLPVLWFYAAALLCSLRLLLDSRSALFVATGGAAAAFILALLVASFGSQSFYPREGALGLWALVLLGYRISVERQRHDADREEQEDPAGGSGADTAR